MTSNSPWVRPFTSATLGLTWAVTSLLAATEPEPSPAGGWAQSGLRVGISETRHVRHSEAFADWQLPWSFSLGRGFNFHSYVSGALGWMGDDYDDTVIGSLGPAFRFTYQGLPLALVGGSAPTFLGRNHLGERNLGCAFQFTSHVGVALQLARRVELGYRLQHISNAGLGDDNPGLNSHAVSLAWRF
jgi:hypothetical protein